MLLKTYPTMPFQTKKCSSPNCIDLIRKLTSLRPKEIASRLIKDHLTLDGNPVLNLASFVTTYMVSA